MHRRHTTCLTGTAFLAAGALSVLPALATGEPGPGGYEASDTAIEAANAVAPTTLLSRHNELLGGSLAFKGTVDERFAGATVVLQRRRRDGAWTEVARATSDEQGRFRMLWATDHIGRFSLRALPLPTEGSAARAQPAVPRRVTVFKPAPATFYGPGLYGERTACGKRLTRRLRGIAHRTLPCGTLVDVYYRGRTLTLPVVDRGPFRADTTWDLTNAAAKALRFPSVDVIGAVRVRDRPVSR